MSSRAEMVRDREFNEFNKIQKDHPDWSHTVCILHQQKLKQERCTKARLSREANKKRKEVELNARLKQEGESKVKEEERMKNDLLKLNQNSEFDYMISSLVGFDKEDLIVKEYVELEKEIKNGEFGATQSYSQILEEMLLISRYRVKRKEKEEREDKENEKEEEEEGGSSVSYLHCSSCGYSSPQSDFDHPPPWICPNCDDDNLLKTDEDEKERQDSKKRRKS